VAGRSLSKVKSIGLALAGYTFWVLTDTSLKLAGNSPLPAAQITALVGLATVAVVLAYAASRGDLRSVWPKHPGRQVLRALLDVGNLLCVVIALRHLPLALFYILVFLAPLVTALQAAVWLGERLSLRNGMAIAAGFLGVVIAVNPLSARRPGDWIGYAACMVCVLCFSTSIVWLRVLTQTETRESLTFFSGLVTAVIGFALSASHLQHVTLRLWPVMLATGVFGVAGSMCFFTALRHATAATVSQFHYSQLLTGALLAYLLWRERPTLSMFVGATLIVGAGWYTAAHKEPVRVQGY
jgi:drug/metabolite transporter (DMT)-like permease